MLTSRAFLVAASLFVTSAALARPQLDAQRLQQIDRWEVLVFSDPHGGGLERGKAIGVIDATPEEVFRVASDFAKYQEYLPRVRSSSVSYKDATQTYVEMTAELPWPVGKSHVTARYTVERLAGETYRLRFGMVRGQMKQYVGQVYIEPWGNGRSAITYEIVAEPMVWAPRSTINKSIKKSAGGFVDALRQRIGDLHRLGYLHPQAPPATQRSPLVGTTPQPSAAKAESR